MFDFDPSKMDPKALAEISRLFQELSPAQISRMQTLMHNMTAGFDVRAEMEEFEKSLPPGFREKLMGLVAASGGAPYSAPPIPVDSAATSSEMTNLREARLTILRAVSERQINPEEALLLLFPGHLDESGG